MQNKSVVTIFAISCVLISNVPTFSEESSVNKSLKVPGARVTLPVESAKKNLPKEFVKEAKNAFNSFHAKMGGDHTLYNLQNLISVMRTDWDAPNPQYKPLEYALNPNIERITITTPFLANYALPKHNPTRSCSMVPGVGLPTS